MVTLKQDKRLVEIDALFLVESLDKYYSVYKLTTHTPLNNTPLELEVWDESNKVNLTLRIQQATFSDNQFEYVLVPNQYYTLLNKTFPGISGKFTTEELLNQYGINPKFKGTNKVWWSLPEAKFKTLMDLISLYSSTPGGGLSFSVSGRGDIDMVDVKNRFENNTICKVDGTIYTDTKNTDWAIRIPSRLKLHISTPTTNIIEDLDLGEGSKASYYINTTDEMAPFIKNKFINDYYIRYYTSHRVVVRGAINGFIPPGVHVEFNNTDFIVFESNINITQSSDTILTLTRPL